MFFSKNISFTESQTSQKILLPLIKDGSFDSLTITNARSSPRLLQGENINNIQYLVPIDYEAFLCFEKDNIVTYKVPVSLIRLNTQYDEIILTRNKFEIRKVWNKGLINSLTGIKLHKTSETNYAISYPSRSKLFALFSLPNTKISQPSSSNVISFVFNSTPLWTNTSEMYTYFINNNLEFLIGDKRSVAYQKIDLPFSLDCTQFLNLCNQLSYKNKQDCIDSISVVPKSSDVPSGYRTALIANFSQKISPYYSNNPQDSISYISHNNINQVNLRGQIDEMNANIGYWIINK